MCYIFYAHKHIVSHCVLPLREQGQVIANLDRLSKNARNRVPTSLVRFCQSSVRTDRQAGRRHGDFRK